MVELYRGGILPRIIFIRFIFWCKKNLHGDIVAVYNDDGVKCISYVYDAWVRTLRITQHNSTGTNSFASENSFRYRGYYFDADLGLYYLNSRYYDPEVGRFINADGYVSTGQGLTGYNMYAYCGNNPVNYVDSTGESPVAIIGLIVLIGVVGIVFTGCSSNGTIEEQNAIDAANQKYNASTININGNNPNVIINVTMNKDGSGFQIEDSYNISNSYEQTAILNTIVKSDLYISEYNDIEAMRIEWSGHNLGYHTTKAPFLNDLVSIFLGREDAHSDFASVDIKGLDTHQDWYVLFTLGGSISW